MSSQKAGLGLAGGHLPGLAAVVIKEELYKCIIFDVRSPSRCCSAVRYWMMLHKDN